MVVVSGKAWPLVESPALWPVAPEGPAGGTQLASPALARSPLPHLDHRWVLSLPLPRPCPHAPSSPSRVPLQEPCLMKTTESIIIAAHALLLLSEITGIWAETDTEMTPIIRVRLCL